MKYPYPTDQRQLDLQKWKPAEWGTLTRNDLVALSSKDGNVAVGTVEDFTCDRTVFWLRISQTGERRFFLSADEFSVWLPNEAKGGAADRFWPKNISQQHP